MADLTTLDATQPPDSQAVGQGALRIRETRDAILTSFAINHHLNGKHKFPQGDTASRPAAGSTGQIYINIERSTLEQEIAGIWSILHGGRILSNYTAASFSLTPSFLDVQTLSIPSPFGATILALFAGDFTQPALNPTTQSTLLGFQFDLDGTILDAQRAAFWQLATSGGLTNITLPICTFAVFNSGFGLSEGNHTLKFQAANGLGPGSSISKRLLAAVLL